MGQEASVPKAGVKLKVIGAGLPRTGTASFSKAMEILLDGPVYHGGTQTTMGPSSHVKSWTKALNHTPIYGPEDEKIVLDTLRKHFDNGYVATTDVPGMLFTRELMQLYPEAMVVCTVRDPKAWVRSIDQTNQATLLWFLSFTLALVPTMRHFPRYLAAVVNGRWGELYTKPDDPVIPGRIVWDRHMEWLKRVVPSDRLMFFDVKDGWERLCQALGKPAPNVPFPRINDGDAIDAFAKKQIQRGLLRWAALLGVATAAAGGWLYLR